VTPASVSRPLLLMIETLASLNFALRFHAFV
jgi:hypothetical protein